jgi:5,5'-dehydrodivanillate O-demethylase
LAKIVFAKIIRKATGPMAGKGALQFADLEPVGPGTPAGRYLRMFWQPVMRARDLAPGRAKPLEILGEKFTIYCGTDGAPHVVGATCAHRRTPLWIGWVEGDDIRCRYHGWRFDCTGQCVEQPNEDKPFAEKVSIPSYPVREYAGLIFAYLGEGAPPPFQTYPDLDRPGVLVNDPVEVLPCTFWNRFDNDHGHRHWVHRATAQRKGRKDVLILHHERARETPYGWIGIREIKGENGDAETSLGEVLKGAKQAAAHDMGMARVTHWFMPNVRMLFQRTRATGFEDSGLWDTKMVWTVPVNDTSHATFDVTLTPIEGEAARAYAESRAGQEDEAETRWDLAEAVLAGDLTLEELAESMSGYTSFTIEDYVTQVGQGPVHARGEETLALGDEGPVFHRRLWLREVGAMQAGKPLTDWRLTDTLLAEDALAVDATLT